MHRHLRGTTAVVFAIAYPIAAQAPTITPAALQRTRAVWFVEGDHPIGAEVGFSIESVAWEKAAEVAFTAAKPGTRIALGTSVWPELQTFTELAFGSVKVAAGNHYAVLERTKEGWSLGLLDPDAVRGAHAMPNGATDLALTASIPLQSKKSGRGASRAEWKQGSKDGTAELTLFVGPLELSATATVTGADGAQPFVAPDARAASRITFDKGAFAIVDHGLPTWNGDLASQAKKLAPGTRWRLGKDWATTLDTNVALSLGDEKLPAGSWHLTLARTDRGWNLVVSSALEDHKARIDAFGADYVTPVIEVPLRSAALPKPAKKLVVEFVADGAGALLAIAFGSERLTVPVATAKT